MNPHIPQSTILARRKRNYLPFIQDMVDGMGVKEVAAKHCLSLGTIHTALSTMRQDFNANDNVHLIAILFREGLVK